jgi:class 3 adenylate cyclase/tetratricopeptide (TPR) repeat protein
MPKIIGGGDTLMPNDVAQWLRDQGFGEYTEEFTKNKIDMDVLPFLTNDDLKDAGVIAVGDRRKLLLAIENKPKPAANVAFSAKEEVSASRRQVTVLFTDISGFTRISNDMDAEETHAMLNRFFGVVDSIIERYGGTVDKHIGDAVMAIFGAPIAHTDDPERALLAASEIQRSVVDLQPPLSVHVGVASGQVVASSTGSTSHAEYTVTGDSVNLAARLTDLAETGETLLSLEVQRAISDQFVCESLGTRPIDGLSTPVQLWRLDHISEERNSPIARFVGRKRELGRFEAAAAHCLAEEVGETLIIRGEAGIGKTQLLKEIERSAKDSGFSVHTGLVLDFGTGKGQDAIRALVRSILTIKPGSAKRTRAEAAGRAFEKGWLNPDQRVFLNDLLDLPQPPELHGLYDAMNNAARNKGRQEILAGLVSAQSGQMPILLLIEDMHWASSLIKDHVARLASIVKGCRSLLVLTTRPTEGTHDDTWLAAIPPAPFSIIDLGPLAEAEVTTLSEAYDNLTPKIKKACIERSGGNPLFLEQLLRNVADLGVKELPGTLQGIVQARLDALSPQDRKAIEAASVLGQRFDLDPLKVLISDQNYQPTGLISAALLRPSGEGYLIAHALIRDGVYATLLSLQKKALHMSAASWFADKDLSLHAEHLSRAGDVAAARAFLSAASEQQSLLRFDAAIRLLKSGLEQELNAKDRFDIQYQYADSLADIGDFEGALAAFRDALVASYDDTTNCLASIRVAEFLSDRQGKTVEESLALLENSEVVADRDQNVENLFRIHEIRRSIYHANGDGKSATAASERMLQIADQLDDPLLQSQAYLGMTAVFYSLGKFVSCEEMLRKTLNIAIPNNLKREELGAHFRLGISRLYNGSASDCLIECDRSLALAGRFGLPRVLCLAHEYKARALIQLGDYQSAETEAQRSLEISHSLKLEVRSILANIHLSSLQRTLGKQKEARRHAESAVERGRASAPRYALPWSLIALSDCLEDVNAAQVCREEALEILRTTSCTSHNYFHVYARLIDCALDHGDWDEAEEFAKLLADYTKNEPLIWTNFVIDRGRVLASIGRGEQGQEIENDLQRLFETGSNAGLMPFLPRLETALSAF